jgi:TRAP-type C4-dicarboxylate transport system permease small subunit
MLKILNFLDRLMALISLMLLICISVTGRYIFNQPIPDDLVFS